MKKRDFKEPTGVDDLGTVIERQIFFTISGGSCEWKGRKLSVQANLNGEPVIYYKGKTFHLPWEHIVWLANERGLFDE